MSDMSITTSTCSTCETTVGDHLSRHRVSTGWLTYYRCHVCRGISAVHTPRISWGA